MRCDLLRTPPKNLSLFPERIDSPQFDPLFHENLAWKAGYGVIAGVDEAGRGPLAGPVVAAAVILPQGKGLPGVQDSKKMTERAREDAFERIHRCAVGVGIGVVSSRDIDQFNILKASLEAMRRAILALDPKPEFLLVDGIHKVPTAIPQRCLIKGDQLALSVSAASVMAKVYRDRIMRCYDEMYPVYDFRNNKGYGTARHLEAIRRYGPCALHRKSFKGVW